MAPVVIPCAGIGAPIRQNCMLKAPGVVRPADK